MSLELVRVRALFLEPGNTIHPSELDTGITEYCVRENRQISGEDYSELNVYRISSAALSDALSYVLLFSRDGMSTPNDPCVEMLVPMMVLYFDVLGVNSDWTGGLGVGECLENCGVFDTFGSDFETLKAHAETLLDKPRAHRSEAGTRVQFLAVYRYSAWIQNGEYDCKHQLEGLADVGVRPFDNLPIKNKTIYF